MHWFSQLQLMSYNSFKVFLMSCWKINNEISFSRMKGNHSVYSSNFDLGSVAWTFFFWKTALWRHWLRPHIQISSCSQEGNREFSIRGTTGMIHTFLYITLHVIRHLCMKCSKHELVLTMNVRNSEHAGASKSFTFISVTEPYQKQICV